MSPNYFDLIDQYSVHVFADEDGLHADLGTNSGGLATAPTLEELFADVLQRVRDNEAKLGK